MTFSQALRILGSTDEQRNLAENIRLVERGSRPQHYAIPEPYFGSIYDPKTYDKRDELIDEANRIAIENQNGE